MIYYSNRYKNCNILTVLSKRIEPLYYAFFFYYFCLNRVCLNNMLLADRTLYYGKLRSPVMFHTYNILYYTFKLNEKVRVPAI